MTNDSFRANIIGNSPELLTVTNSARLVARTEVPVLIIGESGTGKQLLARSIHQASPRIGKTFIAFNCASISEQHHTDNASGFLCRTLSSADQGTVLLNEIGELSLADQGKLLRFLETGECPAPNSPANTISPARVLAATHKDLYQLVQEGRFRKDLYFRLNVVPLNMPPLRDRGSDIELIIRYYLNTLSQHYGVGKPSLGARALKALIKYQWPGNIRELRNLCERLVILHQGKEITLEHLPSEITAAPKPEQPFHFSLPDCGIKLVEFEKRILSLALEKTNGNRSKAARLLGLSRDTFLYRMKKYALA